MKENLKKINEYLRTDIPSGVSYYKENIYRSVPIVNKIYKFNKSTFILTEDGRIYMTYRCLSQEGERLYLNNYTNRISLVPFTYFLKKYVKYTGKHNLVCGYCIKRLKIEFPFFKHLITNISDWKFVDDNCEVIKQTITLLSGDIYELTYIDSSPLEMDEMYCLLDIIYVFPNIWIKRVVRYSNEKITE